MSVEQNEKRAEELYSWGREEGFVYWGDLPEAVREAYLHAAEASGQQVRELVERLRETHSKLIFIKHRDAQWHSDEVIEILRRNDAVLNQHQEAL